MRFLGNDSWLNGQFTSAQSSLTNLTVQFHYFFTEPTGTNMVGFSQLMWSELVTSWTPLSQREAMLLILKQVSKSDQMNCTFCFFSLSSGYIGSLRDLEQTHQKLGEVDLASQRQACWQILKVVSSLSVMTVPVLLPEKAVGCLE